MAAWRVEHALVHVHIDDLRAVRHLLPGDLDRGGIVARFDELAELRRSRDVGALADVDEQAVCIDGEGSRPLKRHARAMLGNRARRQAVDRANDRANVLRRGAAAAPHHVEEAAGRELAAACRLFLGGVSSYSPNAFGKPAFG